MRDASARTVVKVLRLFERTFVEITRGNQCIIDAIPEITCKRSDEFVAALPTNRVDGQWLPDMLGQWILASGFRTLSSQRPMACGAQDKGLRNC